MRRHIVLILACGVLKLLTTHSTIKTYRAHLGLHCPLYRRQDVSDGAG